jgi:glycosyltransferase involved in cell wall biosynthesis
VELFNCIAPKEGISLEVFYLYKFANIRQWKGIPLEHKHQFLNDDPRLYRDIHARMTEFDLMIFHYYRNRLIRRLMNARNTSKLAWCFWGERVGFHGVSVLGALYRKWRLSILHASQVPIWGIGKWAVERYRQEFGNDRYYANVPYFSQLERFRRPENREVSGRRVFLFAGSLISRKGIDLLGRVFCRIAEEFPNAELRILGQGNLRSELARTMAKVSAQTQFLGFVDWDGLPGIFHSADILCVPSRYDGWNLAIPQGLAAGLPVISTSRSGAALELIQPNINGWLIPPGDERELQQAMREAMLLSDEKLREYALNAEASVGNHHLDHGAERFCEAVRQTLFHFPQASHGVEQEFR